MKSVKPWVMFAGVVLAIAVLYWAKAVLVPFAFAILLSSTLLLRESPTVAFALTQRSKRYLATYLICNHRGSRKREVR
jgi:hypothetical protein